MSRAESPPTSNRTPGVPARVRLAYKGVIPR